MADTVQIMAGSKDNIPALGDRVLGWTRDEMGLYIGTPAGNVKVTGQVEQAVKELARDMAVKLSASPAAAQGALAAEADLAAVVGAINALVAAMKASGLMESEVT